MDALQIGLFDLADKRLAWLDQRQQLLAQNIANADTPGFQSRDLPPFAVALAHAQTGAPVRTQPNHLTGTQGGALQPDAALRPTQRAPDGNAVAVDSELTKVADTETAQALVTNLYSKYLGFFRIAFGRSS